MQNQGALHIGQKLRMQSGSSQRGIEVQTVEVVALCEQYVEVMFINWKGERCYIRFAPNGSQVGCRWEDDPWMSGLMGSESGVWYLQEFV